MNSNRIPPRISSIFTAALRRENLTVTPHRHTLDNNTAHQRVNSVTKEFRPNKMPDTRYKFVFKEDPEIALLMKKYRVISRSQSRYRRGSSDARTCMSTCETSQQGDCESYNNQLAAKFVATEQFYKQEIRNMNRELDRYYALCVELTNTASI